MGITITCTNSKYDFDMGYGGFFNLRKNIALCLNKEFGENYAMLSKCISKAQFEENDRNAEYLISKHHLDDEYADILDFLYASDCDGKINYKTCKQIEELLKANYNKLDLASKSFRYGCAAHNDYVEFMEFLRDCYKYHKNMEWR